MLFQALSKAFLASAAAGLATFALTPAAHAELNAPRTKLVRYADLNLASDTGRTTLKRRIAYAADYVCGPADQLSYSSVKWVGDCQARSIANASKAMVTVIAERGGEIRVAAN